MCTEINNLRLQPARGTGLLLSATLFAMNSDSYWYLASASKIVRIGRSAHSCLTWSIWLNDRLIYDNCSDAEEAALRASTKNFSDEYAVDLFSGVSVPSDINMWRTAPPELPQLPSIQITSEECKSHRRRSNDKRF